MSEPDPVTEWLTAIDDFDEGEIPAPPLEELSDWLREGGELDERQSLALLDVIAAQRQQISNADEELAELQRTFDLRRAADQRAIALWQEATGRDLVWPDHADLVVWLAGLVEAHRSLAQKVGLDADAIQAHELPAAIAACLDAEAEAKRVHLERHADLEAVAQGLVDAYARGAEVEQVAWEDIDAVHARAREVLGSDDTEAIAEAEADGHTPHCARRLVWGDGECECAIE